MASEILAATLLPTRPQRAAPTNIREGGAGGDFKGYLHEVRAERKSAHSDAPRDTDRPLTVVRSPKEANESQPGDVQDGSTAAPTDARHLAGEQPTPAQAGSAVVPPPNFEAVPQEPVEGAEHSQSAELRPQPPRTLDPLPAHPKAATQEGKPIDSPLFPPTNPRPTVTVPVQPVVEPDRPPVEAFAPQQEVSTPVADERLTATESRESRASRQSNETVKNNAPVEPVRLESPLPHLNKPAIVAPQTAQSATEPKAARAGVAPMTDESAMDSPERPAAPQQKVVTALAEQSKAHSHAAPKDPRIVAAHSSATEGEVAAPVDGAASSMRTGSPVGPAAVDSLSFTTQQEPVEEAVATIGKFLASAVEDADHETSRLSSSHASGHRPTAGVGAESRGTQPHISTLGSGPSSFVAQLLTAKADATNPVPESAADVARAIADHRSGGRQQVTLQLDPPELGQLRVDIRMHQQAMTLRVGADTHAVARLIQSRMNELEDALASHGIRVERSEIVVRGAPGADTSGSNRGDDPARGQAWRGDQGPEDHRGFNHPGSEGFNGRWGGSDEHGANETAAPFVGGTGRLAGGAVPDDFNVTSPTTELWLDLVA